MLRAWINKWKLRRCLDDEVEPGAHLRRILEENPSLTAWYEHELALIHKLKTTSTLDRMEPSPFLTQRIMHAVDVAEREGAGINPVGIRLPTWIIATVTFAAFAFSFVAIKQTFPFKHSPSLSAAEFQQVSEQFTALVSIVDPSALPTIDEKLNTLLEQELDLAVDDAKRAAGSLAKAFLPSEATAVQWLGP